MVSTRELLDTLGDVSDVPRRRWGHVYDTLRQAKMVEYSPRGIPQPPADERVVAQFLAWFLLRPPADQAPEAVAAVAEYVYESINDWNKWHRNDAATHARLGSVLSNLFGRDHNLVDLLAALTQVGRETPEILSSLCRSCAIGLDVGDADVVVHFEFAEDFHIFAVAYSCARLARKPVVPSMRAGSTIDMQVFMRLGAALDAPGRSCAA